MVYCSFSESLGITMNQTAARIVPCALAILHHDFIITVHHIHIICA